MNSKSCWSKECLYENEAGSRGRGMKNKVCGPKGPWYEVACARKNSMKNNGCGPSS